MAKGTQASVSAYDKALNYLARREYSCHELNQRLTRAGYAPDAIAAAMSQLQQNGYQSDARFVEMLVRTRLNQGYGKKRISYELAQHHIGQDALDAALSEQPVDWMALALNQLQRRYGPQPPADFKGRGKCMQYLARRGFSASLVHDAMDAWQAAADEA